MSNSSSYEQRTAARVPIDLLLNKYVDGQPHLARASNISSTGILLHRVFEPRNDETTVALQFQLPGSEQVITCSGRIVHEHPAANVQGVELTEMPPQQQQILDAFVESYIDSGLIEL